MGTSRRSTLNRPSVQFEGRPIPWRTGYIFKSNNTGLKPHCRFHGSATLFVSARLSPNLSPPANCAAGERQILGNGTQSRPRFLFVVHPVVKININELSTMWQIGLIQLGEVWHSRHLLISADLYGGFWLIFRHPCPVAVVLRFWFLCLRELTGDSLHDF